MFGTNTLSIGAMQAVLAVSVVGGIFVLVGKFAGLFYLATLAQRMLRRDLAAQSRLVAWGYGLAQAVALLVSAVLAFVLPSLMAAAAGAGAGGATAAGPTATSFWSAGGPLIIGVGGCVSGLAALIFGVWAIVLLFIYAGAFRRMENAARAAWSLAERIPTDPPPK